jgi:hypothetical protein
MKFSGIIMWFIVSWIILDVTSTIIIGEVYFGGFQGENGFYTLTPEIEFLFALVLFAPFTFLADLSGWVLAYGMYRLGKILVARQKLKA